MMIDDDMMEKKHYNVVCAVVIDNGEVLCMQKGQTKFPYTSYHWEFPGGKIEEDESPEEALHRELLSKYGGREKIRREHLSQIISYVMNQEDKTKPHTLKTSGTLVYPTVTEDYDFSYQYRDTNHSIHVKTVNLNQDWQMIEQRIKDIIR